MTQNNEPLSCKRETTTDLLVSIQEQQVVKSPELAAKQARLIAILMANDEGGQPPLAKPITPPASDQP